MREAIKESEHDLSFFFEDGDKGFNIELLRQLSPNSIEAAALERYLGPGLKASSVLSE